MTSSSKTPRGLLIPLLISIGIGALVTVVAVVAAWRSHGALIPLRTEKTYFTRERMQAIGREVHSFRQRAGRLPVTLHERFAASGPAADSSWRWEEGWNHPLRYSIEGEEYALTSLGRDGSPGGTGSTAISPSTHLEGTRRPLRRRR
jgi:hypothetical protein